LILIHLPLTNTLAYFSGQKSFIILTSDPASRSSLAEPQRGGARDQVQEEQGEAGHGPELGLDDRPEQDR